MASRRDVLVGGSFAALSLGLVPGGISAAVSRESSKGPVLFLADYTIAAEVAGRARRAGMPVVHYSGDIGVPWLERLQPMWREHPHAVAGVTYGGAFFCLEQLARTRGLACTLRICPPWSGRGQLAGLGAEVAATVLSGAAPRQPISREAPDRPLAWLLQPLAPSQPRG